MYVDACLTGVGAVWDDRVYAAPLIDVFNGKGGIVHFEMLNILLALRLWSHHFSHSHVIIYCDNEAVVQVIQTGKSKDMFLNQTLRNIWLLCSSWDIDLELRHILGHNNSIADHLSRIYSARGISKHHLQIVKNCFIWDALHWSHFHLDFSV